MDVVDELVSLRLRYRRVVVRVARGVYQLAHVFHRRAAGVVHEGPDLESKKWLLLVRRFPRNQEQSHRCPDNFPPNHPFTSLCGLTPPAIYPLFNREISCLCGGLKLFQRVFARGRTCGRQDTRRCECVLHGSAGRAVRSLSAFAALWHFFLPTTYPKQTPSHCGNLARNIPLRPPPRDPLF